MFGNFHPNQVEEGRGSSGFPDGKSPEPKGNKNKRILPPHLLFIYYSCRLKPCQTIS